MVLTALSKLPATSSAAASDTPISLFDLGLPPGTGTGTAAFRVEALWKEEGGSADCDPSVTTRVTLGYPMVRVPVLSNNMVSSL
jgi:hypothetical protein